VEDSVEQNAKRQALFREVNENIAGIAFGVENAEWIDVLCECGHDDCAQLIRLPRAVYESVRSDPTEFVVLRDHVAEDVERVVDEPGRYVIVRNVGRAAEIARATYAADVGGHAAGGDADQPPPGGP
jgi:hypothetical protein